MCCLSLTVLYLEFVRLSIRIPTAPIVGASKSIAKNRMLKKLVNVLNYGLMCFILVERQLLQINTHVAIKIMFIANY